MLELGRLAPWRHVLVGGSVVGVGLAALTGIIGEDHSERFDSKQVVVTPAGTDGLRMREIVDQDFGGQHRHGYERIVPDDFGAPVDVTASSPDAPADVDVASLGTETRIRVGDPDVTVTGQHRYVVSYTLPEARLSQGSLALDIIGTDETLPTDRFEVVLAGWELADTTCNVGDFGDVGGCELLDEGGVYRVVFEPLEPGQGVTVGGRIVGRREVADVPAPALPAPRPDRRVPLAAATTALGALTGGGVYLWARRRGRNEVFSGGAADAAFGVSSLPPPRPGSAASAADAPGMPPAAGAAGLPAGVRLVDDAEMARLATTEFVPPQSVDPWLGRVLLLERLDADAVSAWISAHAARDVLAIERDGDGSVTLAAGPRFADAAAEDRRILEQMLGADGRFTLGRYSRGFAAGWSEVAARQRAFVRSSGMWKRPLPMGGSLQSGAVLVVVAAVFAASFVGRSGLRGVSAFDSPAAALALAVVVPGVSALGAYRSMLPARTAIGSAFALRTESFRRFLAASEARHVEWAWSRGLLREYSAWAVALDTVDAWEGAMQSSSIPPTEFNPAPLLLYHSAAVLTSSRVAPSSSGGSRGGSGGFSGGSVGGGGGGGSSGSW